MAEPMMALNVSGPFVPAPRGASRAEILTWLDSIAGSRGYESAELQFSIFLADHVSTDVDGIQAEIAERGEASWLGGPAIDVGSAWPSDGDGDPLVHVATISLNAAHDLVSQTEARDPDCLKPPVALPPGYLEVFHDLSTWGNADDDVAWVVRHVAEPAAAVRLTSPVEDLALPSEVCEVLRLEAAFDLPFTYEPDDADARGAIDDALSMTWAVWRDGAAAASEPMHAASHMFGCSASGEEFAHDILREVRPLRSVTDQYVLLLSLDGWADFDGWFGDAGVLEVWLRASDLAVGRWDQAWCIIRND